MFSDRRIREALETGKVGVWRWEVGEDRLDWSPNLEAIHGLPAGSFAGTFESFAADIHPDDRARVMDAIQAALAGGTDYEIHYRLPPRPADGVPGAAAGPAAERWVEARGRAELGADGRPVAMTGICQDITLRKRTELELEARLKQQEAIAALGEEALQAPDRQALFDRAVQVLADTLGVEFAKVLELAPDGQSLLLRAGIGWDEGLVGQARVGAGRDSQAGYTLVANGPVISPDLKAESRFCGPPLLHDHGVVSGLSTVIRGAGGAVYGVLGAHTGRPRAFAAHDVTFLQSVASILAGAVQRAAAEERRTLLFHDLRHRTANLFSQLMSIHRQTARTAENVAELSEKYQNRLLAAAQAHDVISRGGPSSDTPLQALLENLLRPYEGRTSLAGPPVLLPAEAAFSLSLALNELATNAAKYGGLSGEEGRLDVRWTVDRPAPEGPPAAEGRAAPPPPPPRLELEWLEQTPRPVAAPQKTSFGSRLIDTIVERQLQGELARDYGAQGLRLRMAVPLGR